MTGLDIDNDHIISISCFITDAQMNLLDDQGFDIVVHLDNSTLDGMGEWCTRTHSESGLIAASVTSTITPQAAAESLLQYIKKHVPKPKTGLLAGNSVHADKAFLRKPPYLAVMNHLHYRILDVSTIKEAARRWAPAEVLNEVPKKKGLHQAREDILESIEEAKFYRDVFFNRK